MTIDIAMRPQVVMLLDNHYGPDRRVKLESEILMARGMRVRIVSWDRRTIADGSGEQASADDLDNNEPEIIRLSEPAPLEGDESPFRRCCDIPIECGVIEGV